MVDRLRGWRGKAAIGVFILASVVTGAWVKSEIDHVVQHWTYGGQERPQSLAGKIVLYYTRNAVEYPGFLPETHWDVIGLYSNAMAVICPLQVVATPSTGGQLNQNPDEMDAGTIREWLGFCLASADGPDGDRCAAVLIPHWSVVVPLFLLAAGLLAWPRRSSPQLVASSEALPRGELPRVTAMTPRLPSRRWKLALTAACAAGVLTCEWIRSSATSDRFRFAFGPSQLLEFVSAREGLVFRQTHTEMDEGFRAQAHYRALTGKDHESLTFCSLRMDVPDGDREIHEFEANDFAINEEVFQPLEPAVAVLNEPEAQPLNEVQQVGFRQTIGGLSVNKPAEGVFLDWFGAYFSLSRNPIGVTIVVPHWIAIIALMLIAALAWRRPATTVVVS